MKALITGASSGIGKSIAIELSKQGYDLILSARDEKRLEEVSKLCKTNTRIVISDLRYEEDIYKLYEEVKSENVDLLINNAGFGLLGDFCSNDLDRELEMIEVNIKSLHILTKLFLKDFCKKDKGQILNVASSAGFMSGPKMATYYATKNYVLKLSTAIYEELRRKKSNVKISVLCPGPVNTNFNKTANCTFAIKGLSSDYVAKYTLKQLRKNKLIIIPGLTMKLGIFFSKFMPTKLLLKITYNLQNRKVKK